ncbi:hypothetical protein TELCIR_03101, partial [Teladorsagia circumcincta]
LHPTCYTTADKVQDAYNSYKNTTERAKADRQLAILRGLDELGKFFKEFEQIHNNQNITIAQEREAIAKLCESLDPATRQAVDYLLRLYGNRPGFSGFGANCALRGRPQIIIHIQKRAKVFGGCTSANYERKKN